MLVQESSSTQRALFAVGVLSELALQLGNLEEQRALYIALALSLALHCAILLIPEKEKPVSRPPATRLEASLTSPTQKPQTATVTPPAAAPKKPAPSKPQQAKRPVLAINKPQGSAANQTAPKWTVAQKAEMNDFLRELESQAKATPRPDLAQRSLSMAREFARQQGKQDREGSEILELLPNAQPVDPFSLEMYLDALVRKLNKSAGFVRNDPRTLGVKRASVQVKLNPDGTLKSFNIVNAGDQKDQIAFVKSVVDKAIPFAPFPSDLRRSASALNMTICIQPASGNAGGFGFSRLPEGSGC